MVRPWYWPEGGQPHRTTPFTWIVKEKMAVSWWPDNSVINRYKTEGIKVIINCSEFDNRRDLPSDFEYFHFSIPDYGTPTKTQLERFLEITSKYGRTRKPMVVHCVAGCGRTGIMTVAWAAYNSIIPKGMDPVKWIRKLRPCCLETKEQMELARKIARKYQTKP
ncbi:MAG: protein-tyrosine phosphatase family protein [Promethearchaeota archaeon]|jgi:protein-tyrosine phosphatase